MSSACSSERATSAFGQSRPISFIALRNSSRSSAMRMASREAPISSTPYFSSTPASARSSAQFSAVWPPMVGSSASGFSLAMMLLDRRRVDRLDVDRVGHVRVGHDRGRVGVDQDHPVALLAQRLAGLRAGVVEFAGLADHDRAGADDQDALDVGAFWHVSVPPSCAMNRSNRPATSCGPGLASGWPWKLKAGASVSSMPWFDAVEQRAMGHAHVGRQRGFVDREAVVLRGDHHPAAVEVDAPDGWRRDGRTSS